METFTLKKDTNNIPVCAFQVGANALNYLAWVAFQVVDDTRTTDAAGVFTTANKPILDADGDGDITAADVLPRRTDTGVTLYVGTAEGEVNSNAGEITLYTDEALTVPAANLEVKCTYWTLVPLAVDNSGRLVLAPASAIEISASALPAGAATEATLVTLATEATLQTIATQVTLAAVEAILTGIRDTAGIKKITDALPAGTNKLGLMGVTNSDGSRHAHVHNSLGDEEDFTQSLSSSAFLLTYNPVSGYWERFKVSDITSLLGALNAAAETDATQSASLNALVKGLLKQLQGNGFGAAPVLETGRTAAKTVIIAENESLSGEVNIEDYSYMAIKMPADWTAANLTFKGCEVSVGTFYDLYDDAGIEVNVTADAQRVIGIDLSVLKIAALSYIKIRSGTSGTPVNQAAERILTIILKK